MLCSVKYIHYFCNGPIPEASGFGLLSEILAFAIILYRLLKLRNFQDNTVGIRLQKPTHSVGASYPLIIGNPKNSTDKGIQKMTSTLFLCPRDLGYRFAFSFLDVCIIINFYQIPIVENPGIIRHCGHIIGDF